MKKWSVAVGSSILALGLLVPTAEASTAVQQQEERVPILVALNENDVSKEQLIKKLKELLPETFSSFKDSDFQMNSMSHHYIGDDVTRYELMFNKKVDKKSTSGSVTFAGGNLDLESYYFQPGSLKDAMFPGKVTSVEAQKVAETFMKKIAKGNDYVIVNDVPSYYSSRVLTDPITYNYSFVRTENGIPIQDDSVMVSVLGDGQIQNFYQMVNGNKRLAFEDKAAMISSQEAINKLKENIQLELQYQINYNFNSGEPYMQLVYQPVTTMIGLHATSNKWYTLSGLSETVPTQAKLERLATAPLKPMSSITVEQAKEIANSLVNKNVGKGKLTLDSAYENEQNGQGIISIMYLYQEGNTSYGSSIDFNKNTGELINYSDFSAFSSRYSDDEQPKLPKLAKDKVLNIALEAVKQLAPSTLHEYSQPTIDPIYDEQLGTHYVTFPKIKNGLIVNGDNLAVMVGDDGQLKTYNRSAYQIDEWPDAASAIEKTKAIATFKEALSAKLVYTRASSSNPDEAYKLVYIPTVKGQEYYHIDAQTGQIVNGFINGGQDKPTVTHPTAEKELNYLIQAGAIEVKDASQFNADIAITKGQALKTILKSLTYFYYDDYNQTSEKPTSFDNIDPKHPLYQVVESASANGILKPGQETFNPDEKMTREELAVWFIRTLGLEQAAKHSGIYNVSYADKEKISEQYKGYVALSQAMGLQKLEQSNFNPTHEVTYADLAVSIIQLAYEIADKRQSGMYY
ncbi:S-layer homology domain-containing protein [Solibacillus sp. FSL K6-1523]|uniref:S-layer homology domain-containing protein n=1 Tax=Solibacillus sp. FSL K6-1523 TaxID=2921471 RepID=UPI0030FC6350